MAGTFLKIEGIKGKSRQEGRTDCLDVSTWNISAQVHVDVDSSKGSLTTGQGWLTDLNCDITCDTTVVRQLTSCLGGRHFTKANLTVTKDVTKGTELKAVEFVVMDMEDVIISGVHLGGHVGGEPSLRIGIKFARYKLKYILYDEKGNKVDQDTDGYDLPKHTGWA
jgi:type VI protein secretion system component Hcp